MTRKTPAAEQFKTLGIPEADWTPAMRLAVKQRWSGLPVDVKVVDLRARLAAVVPAEVPTVDDLADVELATNGFPDRDVAAKEHTRLKRNAAVNAWRERGQIQAALDARDLKFAALRAKKQPTPVAPASSSPVEVSV